MELEKTAWEENISAWEAVTGGSVECCSDMRSLHARALLCFCVFAFTAFAKWGNVLCFSAFLVKGSEGKTKVGFAIGCVSVVCRHFLPSPVPVRVFLWRSSEGR